MEPFIEMRGIHKVYPDGTVALRGVDFRLYRGEIVGLLGENGAGKTTLMKILSGLLPPTQGEIRLEGRSVRFRNPSDALRAGIGMVHQIFTLVPPYTALENILLGQEGSALWLRKEQARPRVERLLEEVGLSIPLDVPVELLPIGVQQRVEILKVLYRGTRVLILDEPTSALTPLEVDELFKFMRRLKEDGRSIVFITHKLREVLEICDRIVVLRNGLVTGEVQADKATPELLAERMVGHAVVPRVSRSPRPPGEPILVVRDLEVMGDLGVPAVRGVSFEVRAGEIFGIAGVEGNGQSELAQALGGLRPIRRGEILLDGKPLPPLAPIEAYRQGISHIPEDRLRFGLALHFDVAENSILSRQWEPLFLRGWVGLDWPRILAFAAELVQRFQVLTPGVRATARHLSGGNQQKLVVGRELSKEPRLILAVHPTRGLDVASTAYIRELLIRMRDQGKAVLLISADLDEILELSDRIAVMYEGKFLSVGPAEAFSRTEIGMLMGGILPQEQR